MATWAPLVAMVRILMAAVPDWTEATSAANPALAAGNAKATARVWAAKMALFRLLVKNSTAPAALSTICARFGAIRAPISTCKLVVFAWNLPILAFKLFCTSGARNAVWASNWATKRGTKSSDSKLPDSTIWIKPWTLVPMAFAAILSEPGTASPSCPLISSIETFPLLATCFRARIAESYCWVWSPKDFRALSALRKMFWDCPSKAVPCIPATNWTPSRMVDSKSPPKAWTWARRRAMYCSLPAIILLAIKMLSKLR